MEHWVHRKSWEDTFKFLKLAEKKRRLLAEIYHLTSATEECLENMHHNIEHSAWYGLIGWIRAAFGGRNFLFLGFLFTDIVRKMILTLVTCRVHELLWKVRFLRRLKIFFAEQREDAPRNIETATPNDLLWTAYLLALFLFSGQDSSGSLLLFFTTQWWQHQWAQWRQKSVFPHRMDLSVLSSIGFGGATTSPKRLDNQSPHDVWGGRTLLWQLLWGENSHCSTYWYHWQRTALESCSYNSKAFVA